MNIILAMDLKNECVVHGNSGNRMSYTPLTWGLAPSAKPLSYIASMRPKYLYIADIDRIEMQGDHTELIFQLANQVDEIWVDRGCRTPEEYLQGENIHNIVGTETVNTPINKFNGGFLSVDVKENRMIYNTATLPPIRPEDMIRAANKTNFDGCIFLNISLVGTSSGINPEYAKLLRSCSKKQLYYGGGIRSIKDLQTLADSGFDGAIVTTAVHRGSIPIEIIQEGSFC